MLASDKHTAHLLDQLKSGAILSTARINSKSVHRRFYLHEQGGYITHEKSLTFFSQPRIYHIKDINEVRCGFRTHVFEELIKNEQVQPADETRAFTLIHNNRRDELHLMASDQHTRDTWVEGLQLLINQHARKHRGHSMFEENWISSYFRIADTNKVDSLSKQECRDLLSNSFNIDVPNNMFEELFQKVDQRGNDSLSSGEFVALFHQLTRRTDLYELMQKYTRKGDGTSINDIAMNINELVLFLERHHHQIFVINDSQGKQVTMKSIDKAGLAQDLINEFEMDVQLKEKDLLSVDGFRNMLLSDHFDIVKPALSRQIYQDMTKPLCDYYISTSHNTYLNYWQVFGDSNPEAYNRVLLAGCRAVELDCYDGPDGQPIVTHGRTLVNPCPFESIIRHMEPNLFQTSPYPLILNIENHCSIEQQHEMVRILKEILGDRLATLADSESTPTVLPSPEDLKYKVLVRSRKHGTATKRTTTVQLEDDDDSIVDPLSKDIAEELANTFIYLRNVPYREHDYAKEHYSPLHTSSLSESHFTKVSGNDPSELILQTTWRLLRTYPDHIRIDSSNPNPIDVWNHGIQMAALNYQSEDQIMPLCYGKFLDNGGCGYTLKPPYLINAQQTNYSPIDCPANLDRPLILNLTIISAQFLFRTNVTSIDIPSPFVNVSIHGLPCDQQIQKTQAIDKNGLNPRWDETFSFPIRYPQMSLVYFSVLDADASTYSDKLAHFCLPVTMMQTGYRHVHLRAMNNDRSHSTLFVHVDIQINDTDNIIT